jgi:alkaline phosphatase
LRKDGRNLIQEWQAKYTNGTYVTDQNGFDAIAIKPNSKVLGLFSASHMAYAADRKNDKLGEPSLTEMTAKAIDLLSVNPKGFVLVIEAGRIDHAHHASNAFRALTDTIELSNAVRTALSKTDSKETLLIVTADHSHTFSISGYPERGNPILGLVKEVGHESPALDRQGHPYTTLMYANGPGHRHGQDRPDLTQINTQAPDYLQESVVDLENETHGAEDVAIFASGPKAHLFHGVQEESYIFQVMAHALRFKPGQ